jgi:hypothetical protein
LVEIGMQASCRTKYMEDREACGRQIQALYGSVTHYTK